MAQHITIPAWASSWRAQHPDSRAVRVNDRGVVLTRWGAERHREEALIGHDHFRTDNAALFALSNGGVVFKPCRSNEPARPRARGAAVAKTPGEADSGTPL